MPPEFYQRLFRNLVMRRNGHLRMSCRPWSRKVNMGFRKSGKQPRILLKRVFPWMIERGFKSLQGDYMTPYGQDARLNQRKATPKKGAYLGPGMPSKRTNPVYGHVGTAVFKNRKGPRSEERIRIKTTGR
ncbi:hypothetical protein D3C71_175120 [compost metagenome]